MMFQGLLAGHTVAQAMSERCVAVPAEMTLQQIVDEHILASGQRCYLLSRGDATVGLMTLHRVRQVPRSAWPTTRAENVMLPIHELRQIGPDTELWSALQEMDRDGVNQLPVVSGGRVVGMLTREDVITFLRTLRELGR
jgi:predicted transcriptional regulator